MPNSQAESTLMLSPQAPELECLCAALRRDPDGSLLRLRLGNTRLEGPLALYDKYRNLQLCKHGQHLCDDFADVIEAYRHSYSS